MPRAQGKVSIQKLSVEVDPYQTNNQRNNQLKCQAENKSVHRQLTNYNPSLSNSRSQRIFHIQRTYKCKCFQVLLPSIKVIYKNPIRV